MGGIAGGSLPSIMSARRLSLALPGRIAAPCPPPLSVDAMDSSDRPPAGSPYGSLSEGPSIGYEIRPALPVYAFDPVLGPGDLGYEGDEVVEITIDETGNVIHTTVLQSLGRAVDAKVLAVLQSWRFHPATRDGLAIASRQDVHYHFKPHS